MASKELTRAVKKAIKTKLRSWEAERDVEGILGGDLDDLPQLLSDYCGGYGSPADVTDKDASEVADAIQTAYDELCAKEEEEEEEDDEDDY